MKFSELVKFNKLDREQWLRENVADFDQLPFEGELIGYIIHCDNNHLEEYIKFPEDYETGSMIKSVFSELSLSREQEINEGAKITLDEKKYLKEAVVEKLSNDEFEGDTYTVCAIELDRKTQIFVTFCGQLTPHPSWTFDNIYETEEHAINAIKTLSADEYFFPI